MGLCSMAKMSCFSLQGFLLFLCNVKFGNASKFNLFLENSSLDNNMCRDREAVFMYKNLGKSRARCLLQCLENSACISVFLDEGTGYCIGCNEAYRPHRDFLGHTGSRHYALQSRLYGQKCNSDDICKHANQVCWDGRCMCQIGYSYDKTTNTCVESCFKYGTSFQKYPERRLFGANDINIKGLTLEGCKDLCLATNCLSIEYKVLSSVCHTANATALTKPGLLEVSEKYDYYTRNCE